MIMIIKCSPCICAMYRILINPFIHKIFSSHCFQKPKNSFNLFKKKAADERPLFENNPKPSTSTGFFATKPQQPPATPLNTRNPREDVTLSNCSNTTEKNKQVLLNLYLQEQYNSVLKTKYVYLM